jgi:signal transduction histidine kinase
MPELDPDTQQSLQQLDTLIGELRDKVSALREGELDASALETRLRELTDLASRAASTLESVSR